MSNRIKQEMNRIEIPRELSERSKRGVSKAKKEMQIGRKRFYVTGILVAAILLISIGTNALFNDGPSQKRKSNNQKAPTVTESGGVKIPAIRLPKDTSNAKMIGLIVYKGKVYTEARTEIDAENAKAIIEEKLGTTKGNIDEWSTQDAYADEFASTTGVIDVYSVKGYDKDIRIMTYEERDGKPFAEFFENLNGLTINSGEDVFGKFKMTGNVLTAKYRKFDDWNNGVENYHSIEDMIALKNFVEELNKTKPLPRTENFDPFENSRNNEEFKDITIQLNDGINVKLFLLKDGYIYYGFMEAYFKMDDEIFLKMWSQLK